MKCANANARLTHRLVAVGSLVATILVAQPTRSAPPPMPPRLQKTLGRLSAGLVRRGLPTDLLESKAREGLAKHVPFLRIALVLRSLAGFIIEGADLATKRWPQTRLSADLARAYAEARLAGLSRSRGQRILATARSPKDWPRVTAALDLTSDLVGAGYPARGAAALSGHLLTSRSRIYPNLVMGTLTWLVKTQGLTKTVAITRLLRFPDHLSTFLSRQGRTKPTKGGPVSHGHHK